MLVILVIISLFVVFGWIWNIEFQIIFLKSTLVGVSSLELGFLSNNLWLLLLLTNFHPPLCILLLASIRSRTWLGSNFLGSLWFFRRLFCSGLSFLLLIKFAKRFFKIILHINLTTLCFSLCRLIFLKVWFSMVSWTPSVDCLPPGWPSICYKKPLPFFCIFIIIYVLKTNFHTFFNIINIYLITQTFVEFIWKIEFQLILGTIEKNFSLIFGIYKVTK